MHVVVSNEKIVRAETGTMGCRVTTRHRLEATDVQAGSGTTRSTRRDTR
jgi:hypothetical protein